MTMQPQATPPPKLEITDDYRRAFETTIEKYWTKKRSDKPEKWLKFMRDELRYTPDDCVIPIVESFSQGKDTVVRASHGIGKTTVSVALGLTAMVLTPELLMIQISPTWRQVLDPWWKELRKWYLNSQICQAMFEMAEKAPRMESRLDPYRWYAQGLASNQPSMIEGKHNKRILLVCDETKAIPDGIIEAVQGALTGDHVQRLYASTPSVPGENYTAFYNCFSRNRSLWVPHHISAYDSPRVSKEWIERMKEEYGEESQVFKARVLGEFPEGSGDYLISLRDAEQFFVDNVKAEGHVVVSADIARFGDDESVLSVWRGDNLEKQFTFDKKSVTQISKIIKEIAFENDARAIGIDDIGIGGGVTDTLASDDEIQNCDIIPFVSSQSPTQPDKFKTLGDEVWFDFAKALKSKQCTCTHEDDKLLYQLSSYKIAYTAQEQIRIEWPKRRERQAEQKSPDRADSAVIGWHIAQLVKAAYADGRVPTNSRTEHDDEDDDYARYRESLEFAGIRNRKF